jgi:predicted DNA-binding protein
MVRKQLYLTAEQDRRLARRASTLGVTQAELVRVAIDRFLAEKEADTQTRAWERLESTLSAIADSGAMDGAAKRQNRDELHDR